MSSATREPNLRDDTEPMHAPLQDTHKNYQLKHHETSLVRIPNSFNKMEFFDGNASFLSPVSSPCVGLHNDKIKKRQQTYILTNAISTLTCTFTVT